MIDAIETQINLVDMGKRAKAAGIQLARATTEQKNAVIIALADALEANSTDILVANKQDVDEARANGTDEIWIKDRLDLTKRMTGMIADVRNVATLPDPVGKVFDAHTLDNGLKVSKRRTPLGVLGVIYEARPNVTIDVAVLAIKSSNAAILRGGKEAMRSNLAMIKVLRDTVESCGLPAD